jgi:hypothetical protein
MIPIILPEPSIGSTSVVKLSSSFDRLNEPLSPGDFMTWMFLTLFAHSGGISVPPTSSPSETAIGALSDLFTRHDLGRLSDCLSSSPTLSQIVENTVYRPFHSQVAHTFSAMQLAANEAMNTISLQLLHWSPGLICDVDPSTGRTAVHVAAEASNRELISIALQKSADIECLAHQDWLGWTLFHMVARNADAVMFNQLSDAIAHIDIGGKRDWRGRTAASMLDAHRPLEGVNPRVFEGDGDGGWPQDTDASLLTNQCDIAQIDGPLSSSEFISEYVSAGRPVILRRSTAAARLLGQWTLDNIRKKYGHLEFPITTAPYSHVYGSDARLATLSDYIDWLTCNTSITADCQPAANFSFSSSSKPYLFTELNEVQFRLFDHDLDDIIRPPLLEELPGATAAHRPQFYLGPSGSGAQMHFHQVLALLMKIALTLLRMR